jgi:thiol-disulfide isomerase/thioredoxin
MSKGKWMVFTVLLASALVVVVLALSRSASSDASASVGVAQYSGSDGTITLLAPANRTPAPPLTGRTLDGDSWALTDSAGYVVVLNVWASWCAPCRAEAPTLRKVSEDMLDDGVRFFGLNTRDSTIAAKAFEKTYGITYPSIDDQDGQLLLRFAGTLNPSAIPSTVVIDQQGRIAGAVLGRISESTLRGLLEPLLAEAATSAPPASDGVRGATTTEDD